MDCNRQTNDLKQTYRIGQRTAQLISLIIRLRVKLQRRITVV